MATLKQAYQGIANINLWLKQRSGDAIMLSDVPTIIPLRWTYFRDNWEFIKPGLQNKVKSYFDPDFMNSQIIDFNNFITIQRHSTSNVNPFSDAAIFFKFYAIFDNTEISAISLTNEEVTLMNNAIALVKLYSKNDFVAIKKTAASFRDTFADTVGLDDSQYDLTYNRSPVAAQTKATITDINFLLTFQGAVTTANFILANLFAVDTAIDPFALARANANNPNVDIGSYASGYLVRLNYGDNLETLAAKYLGDPDKWLDIAIANGLKPPYIDEIGSMISLLANGNGNQINIAGTDPAGNLNIDKIYINQPVFLQSVTEVLVDQRSIVNIKQIPVSNEIVIELDGAANLDLYKTSDSANIRVYLPSTVNSSFYVLIPSTEPLDDDRKEEVPWFLAKSADDEKRAKVDLAIDNNGEINFTTNGDIMLSFGLDNAIQAMRLKVITELGTLRYHPTYGLVNVVGKVNTDVDAVKTLMVESLTAQVAADPRFDRIESLDVEYVASNASATGVSAIAVIMSVRMAGGGNRVLPISFMVNNPS